MSMNITASKDRAGENKQPMVTLYFIGVNLMRGTDKKTPPITLYYLARSYHLEYKLDSAIANYNRYKKYIDPSDQETLKDIEHQIVMCNNAKLVFANPISTTIENLGPVINTKYDEYAPVLDALESTLIFTSRREGTTHRQQH